MSEYLELCEGLWTDWLQGKPPVSAELEKRFDLDAAPEPYLRFGESGDPLVVITTNPGATMDHQRRDVVLAGKSAVSPEMHYEEAAVELAKFYESHLTGAANVRLQAQKEIAGKGGYQSVLQVECIPWHSSNLPVKGKVVKLMRKEPICIDYVAALRRFLKNKPAVALSAVSTHRELGIDSIQASPWLSGQAELINLNADDAEFLAIGRKGSKTTSGALIDRSGASVKAIVLMMGGNHWPDAEKRGELAAALGD